MNLHILGGGVKGAFRFVAARLSFEIVRNGVASVNAGDALRQIYGNAEATQVQDILNRAIRNRQQVFLAYRGDLSKPKATASSSN